MSHAAVDDVAAPRCCECGMALEASPAWVRTTFAHCPSCRTYLERYRAASGRWIVLATGRGAYRPFTPLPVVATRRERTDFATACRVVAEQLRGVVGVEPGMASLAQAVSHA